MDFDEVICYSGRGGDNEPFIRDEIGGQYTTTSSNQALKKPTPTCKIAIGTYGNGVVESMQARRGLADRQVITTEEELDVIDCPYLSDVPKDWNVSSPQVSTIAAEPVATITSCSLTSARKGRLRTSFRAQ